MSVEDVAARRYAVDIDETESPSEAVVRALAAVSGLDIVPQSPAGNSLEPLYSVIDPEALDAVFHPGSMGTVTFTYHGYEVTVHGRSHVTLERPQTNSA